MPDIASLQQNLAAAKQWRDQAAKDREYYETKMREADDAMKAADAQIYSYRQQIQDEASRMQDLIREI